jgi:hypothetical protein
MLRLPCSLVIGLVVSGQSPLSAQEAAGVRFMTPLPATSFDFKRNTGSLKLFARSPTDDSVIQGVKTLDVQCWTGWPLQPSDALTEARSNFCSHRTYDYLRELGMDRVPIALEVDRCRPIAEAFVKQCDAMRASTPVDLLGVLQYLSTEGALGQQNIATRLLTVEAEQSAQLEFLRTTVATLKSKLDALEHPDKKGPRQ